MFNEKFDIKFMCIIIQLFKNAQKNREGKHKYTSVLDGEIMGKFIFISYISVFLKANNNFK